MKNLLTVTFLAILTGCFNSSGTQTANFSGAALTTFSGSDASDVVVIDENYELIESLYPQSHTDLVLSKGHNSLYLINRYNHNNIIKFTSNEIGTEVWQYSTNSEENEQSNPYSLIEVNDNKAYVLRYGSGNLWQVNPSAQVAADFKTNTIDLSEFDSDGTPEMTAAVLHGEHLYVVLQRLVYFKADQPAQIVAINVNDNSITDLSPSDESTKAYTLQTINPGSVDLKGDDLYVQSVGRYAVKDWETGEVLEPIEYTGGIERVNLSTLSSQLIVDDGDSDSHPYGQVFSVSVYQNSIAFSGYNGWQDLTVYIKEESAEPKILDSDLTNRDIRFAKFDAQGQLWVGIADSTDGHVRIYTKNSDGEFQVDKTIYTTLLPHDIIFK